MGDRHKKCPGLPGKLENLDLINLRMDFRFPGKQLHQQQLRGIVDTRIHRRIYSKACHPMANSRRRCLISEWCHIQHNHRCNER